MMAQQSVIRQFSGLRKLLVRIGLLIGMLVVSSQAEVTTLITPDGSTPSTAIATSSDGRAHTITGKPYNGGRNLFHSFTEFNVGTGHTVHFASGAGVENIISRITGDNPSCIDGVLGADANLFFLNPNGVIFGAGASLNINGSFYVSTADKLGFADGVVMTADLGVDSQFSVEDPKFFGFTRNMPGAIEIRNSRLAIQSGDLALIGGDITIGRRRLRLPGAQVQLVSTASPNEVFITTSSSSTLEVQNPERLGNISLSGVDWEIDHLVIRGHTLNLNGGLIQVHESIDIDVEGDMTVSGTNMTGGSGRQEGDRRGVHIQANTLLVDNAMISWRADDVRTSTMTVEVNRLMLVNNGALSASVVNEASGGTITVKATDEVIIRGRGSGIFSTSQGRASAGDIRVETQTLMLQDDGVISAIAATAPGESSQGGSVTIRAENVRIESGGGIATLVQGEGTGTAGDITLTGVETLALDDGTISVENTGMGNAGTVLIEADRISLTSGSMLTAEAAQGDGGNIDIDAQSLTLQNSKIEASAPEGRGGNIFIRTNRLDKDTVSQIDASGRIDGTVTIEFSQDLTALPKQLLQAEKLLYQRCAERLREGQASSFVLAGRDDIRIEATGKLPRTFHEIDALDVAGETSRALVPYRSAMQHGHYQKARRLLDETLRRIKTLPASADKARSLIDIALAYNHLRHLPGADAKLVPFGDRLLQEAGAVATASHTPRTAAYAWGYLGALYESEQHYQQALTWTRRAVFETQQVLSPESLYRWQWQTGRLLRELGDHNAAMAAYQRAVATAQSIRPLSERAGQRAASFRQSVGALYLELVDLYLRRAAALEERLHEAAAYHQYEFYLERARATVEQFKEAELRDYLGDDCVNAAFTPLRRLYTLARNTAIVYPILLPDRIELLVNVPADSGTSELRRFAVPVEAKRLMQEVQMLRRHLDDEHLRKLVESTIFPELPQTYRSHAQTLYNWLVRPFEASLAALPIDTLVFVPDGPLRTIPMAALHDGRQFLIEKYALAVTPGLLLIDPTPIEPGTIQVLAAGLSEPVQGRAGLPLVAEELETVQSLYGGVKLLNENFCLARVEQELRYGQFGILHIASHGEFVKDIAKSFILTFDDKLSIDDVERLVGPLRFRDRPLELLTLSSCQTAVDDDRAALGLAGMAIRAGARSALATLWSIQDESTPFLMAEFYRQLNDPEVSRALALQRAQLKLMRDTTYDHPYFWSPFLLINNWL